MPKIQGRRVRKAELSAAHSTDAAIVTRGAIRFRPGPDGSGMRHIPSRRQGLQFQIRAVLAGNTITESDGKKFSARETAGGIDEDVRAMRTAYGRWNKLIGQVWGPRAGKRHG